MKSHSTPKLGWFVMLAITAFGFVAVEPTAAATFTVTSIADPGDGVCDQAGVGDGCTLREAITASNVAGGNNTITFLSYVRGTIQLTAALPDLNSNITLTGPGANLLLVSGQGSGNRFRIFTISTGVTVNISNLTITNGFTADGTAPVCAATTPGVDGGGIYNSGELNLTNVAVTNNRTGRGADGTVCSIGGAQFLGIGSEGGKGGGIYNAGTLNISNSTVSGNRGGDGGNGVNGSAGGEGGGISNSGTLNITNSTVSGNVSGAGNSGALGRAARGGDGGGIANDATLTVTNSTISSNQTGPGGPGDGFFAGVAGSGGGIRGNCNLQSTIVAGNSAGGGGPDINGTVQSDGYNLLQDTSGTTINLNSGAGPDLTNVDPRLGPLQNNGGLTQTHALLSDSPAIDAGKNFSGSTMDQRGAARSLDITTIANVADATDIGAFEFHVVAPASGSIVVNVLSDSDDGACTVNDCSLREAIKQANATGDSTITFIFPLEGVIQLTSALPDVQRSIALIGPGADKLTVQRSTAPNTPAFRIFSFAPQGNIDLVIGANSSITGVTIANGLSDDASGARGGGVFNSFFSSLTLEGVHVRDNLASGANASGGGIHNEGSLIVRNSTISGNTALDPSPVYGGDGGGISSNTDSVGLTGRLIQVINCTVSGNSADGPGGGISLHKARTDAASGIFNSTIAFNTAGSLAGGLSVQDSSSGQDQVRLRSSIISNNTGRNGVADDLQSARPVISDGFNLVRARDPGSLDAGGWQPTDLAAGTDPLLQPLASNGGPMPTHRLGAGSPAIDKGIAGGLSTDGRGFARTFDNPSIANADGGDGSDIGAVEIQQVSGVAFKTQPSTTAVGGTIVPAVEVQMVDEAGAPAVGAVDRDITIALGSNTTGATLSGTKTVRSVQGVAKFDDLSIDKPGSGYTLTASTDLGSATSNSFNIENPATQFEVSVPATADIGAAFNFTVRTLDADGNPSTLYRGTVAITSDDPNGTLPANYTFTATDAGQHTFSARFSKPGMRTITVTDTVDSSLTAASGLGVPPPAPGAPDLEATSDTGSSDSDNLTNNRTPTFMVTPVIDGATVHLFRAGGEGAFEQVANGTSVELTDIGACAFGVECTLYYTAQQSIDGVMSAPSAELKVVVDMKAPEIPSLDLSAVSDSGVSNSDHITNASSLVFGITGQEDGVLVQLLDHLVGLHYEQVVGSTTVSSGQATITINAPGADSTFVYWLRVTDAAGNMNEYPWYVVDANGLFVTIDRTAPVVSISGPSQAAAKTGSAVTYTVSYDDANFGSSTLSTGDIVLNKTGTANATISVSGSGNTRVVTLSGISGEGTLGISVASGTASDLAGNIAPAAGPGETFTLDDTAPSVTINQASGQADPTDSLPINFTVVFSESVADFDATGVTLTGSAASTATVTVTGSGTTYNVAVSGMTTSGTITASIAAEKAHDGAGNGNIASTSSDNTVTYNNVDVHSSFVVNSTADTDNGACTQDLCTLRDAINAANLDAGPETITFDPALTANGRPTITVSDRLPDITSDISIEAPSAGLVVSSTTGSNSPNFPGLFTIVNGTVTLENLTIRSNSIGIKARGGTTFLESCTIQGSPGAAGVDNQAAVIALNCTITGWYYGINNVGNATLQNCTVTGNSNGVIQLAPYDPSITTRLFDSIVAGNTTNVSVPAENGVPPPPCPPFCDPNNITTGTATDAGLQTDNNGNAVLADNGGPAETVLLVPGSPAINAGSDVTTLNGAIDNATVTVTVSYSTNLPVGSVLQLENEQMLVTGFSGILPVYVNSRGSTVLTVTRGYNNTTAAAHGDGTAVNPAFDQRGYPRKVGTAIDFGAVESNYALAVTGGDNQSAPINTAYAVPLGAALTESGVAQPNVSVTFAAPSSGPSGTFAPSNSNTFSIATGSNGVATASAFSANGRVGAFQVSVTVAGLPAVNGYFNLINSKGTPTLIWTNPGDIIYGTALDSSQLNATASVPGSFDYTPTAGTVLNAGDGQTLSVNFTPTDTTNYNRTSAGVSINVVKANQSINVTVPAPNAAQDGSSFTVSASATSALPVSYSSSGACTNNGSTYTMTSAPGTCTVLMSQIGDSNYNAAPQVSESVAATGSASPTPTATPTATASPTPTATATATPTATASPTATPPSQVLNVSTRGNALIGEDVMIGGFTIAGNAPKTVLVRAIGPSTGVPGSLQDPVLDLYLPGGAVVTNDNWRDAVNADQIPASLQPQDPRESAILVTLPADAYTAVVHGKAAATGIALVEVYDLSMGTPSKIVNISTRGVIQTGDNRLIGGFVLSADQSTTMEIVVRAIGPSLSDWHILNPIADPFLDVRDANGSSLATNDNWKDDPNAATVKQIGLAPGNDLESALYLRLPLGAYTAIVSRNGGTDGVGLVEVYSVTNDGEVNAPPVPRR
jgi:CSLREA domain-containing protein